MSKIFNAVDVISHGFHKRIIRTTAHICEMEIPTLMSCVTWSKLGKWVIMALVERGQLSDIRAN